MQLNGTYPVCSLYPLLNVERYRSKQRGFIPLIQLSFYYLLKYMINNLVMIFLQVQSYLEATNLRSSKMKTEQLLHNRDKVKM